MRCWSVMSSKVDSESDAKSVSYQHVKIYLIESGKRLKFECPCGCGSVLVFPSYIVEVINGKRPDCYGVLAADSAEWKARKALH